MYLQNCTRVHVPGFNFSHIKMDVFSAQNDKQKEIIIQVSLILLCTSSFFFDFIHCSRRRRRYFG